VTLGSFLVDFLVTCSTCQLQLHLTLFWSLFSPWFSSISVFKMVLAMFSALGLGQLPKEYNPRVHGPYDPAIYYGKSEYGYLYMNKSHHRTLSSHYEAQSRPSATI